MTRTLDELMSLDPLELSSRDIDDIIAAQRKLRANYEAGVKPTKGDPTKPKVDLLSSLGLNTPKTTGTRRV